MLALSRKLGEAVKAGDLVVYILEIKGNQVRLGFEAPPEVPVHRGEICKPPILKLPPQNKKGGKRGNRRAA